MYNYLAKKIKIKIVMYNVSAKDHKLAKHKMIPFIRKLNIILRSR